MLYLVQFFLAWDTSPPLGGMTMFGLHFWKALLMSLLNRQWMGLIQVHSVHFKMANIENDIFFHLIYNGVHIQHYGANINAKRIPLVEC